MRYSFLMAAAVLGLATSAGAQGTQPPTRLPATKVTAAEGRTITIQNDRREVVRFFVESGKVERLVGTVPAGSTEQLQLPDWATKGKRTLSLIAYPEGTTRQIASYEVPVADSRMLGLLVPPAEGLPLGDSVLIALPKGIGSAATVTVENARALPVTVYAEQGLRFVRLGEVAANQQGTLALPKALLTGKDGVRIFARPADAPQRSTQALKLREGDHVSVIVM